MNETNNIAQELAEANAKFTETVLKIADKYEVNRTTLLQVTANTFLETAYNFNYDKYQFKEETNNE